MKIVTWNVNGIRAREAQLQELVDTQKPDVICLQETKATLEQVPPTLVELPGYWCYWHGEKGYSGVALHLAKSAFPARPEYFHPDFDHEHRIVCARIGPRVLASMYVPNGGKDFAAKQRFLDALDLFVKAGHARGDELVLCGDYNVARERRDVHPSLQKEQEIGQTPGERAKFAGLLAEGLVDLGRHFAPDDDRLYTWWAPWRNLRQKNVGWRLDYVLASEPVAKKATSCTASREFGTSDHGPVTAVFDE
ncbi:MAG: exodeoxyribonuclease III [Sandaracinus sp.]